jgi:hypothetical protein
MTPITVATRRSLIENLPDLPIDFEKAPLDPLGLFV